MANGRWKWRYVHSFPHIAQTWRTRDGRTRTTEKNTEHGSVVNGRLIAVSLSVKRWWLTGGAWSSRFTHTWTEPNYFTASFPRHVHVYGHTDRLYASSRVFNVSESSLPTPSVLNLCTRRLRVLYKFTTNIVTDRPWRVRRASRPHFCCAIFLKHHAVAYQRSQVCIARAPLMM